MSTVQFVHIGADIAAFTAVVAYFSSKIATLEEKIKELEKDTATTARFLAHSHNTSDERFRVLAGNAVRPERRKPKSLASELPSHSRRKRSDEGLSTKEIAERMRAEREESMQ